jgi:hypothetical protein
LVFAYQALLIFERKIFRRIYVPKYEDGEWKSRTNREIEDLSKGENVVQVDKGTKDKLAGSPGENGGRWDAQKALQSRTGRVETKRKTQERMERRRSRKRSSSSGSEKMERVGDREKWRGIVRQAKAHSGL